MSCLSCNVMSYLVMPCHVMSCTKHCTALYNIAFSTYIYIYIAASLLFCCPLSPDQIKHTTCSHDALGFFRTDRPCGPSVRTVRTHCPEGRSIRVRTVRTLRGSPLLANLVTGYRIPGFTPTPDYKYTMLLAPQTLGVYV